MRLDGFRVNFLVQEEGKTLDFKESCGHFRVTLYNAPASATRLEPWESVLIEHLTVHSTIYTKDAATLWGVTPRTARTRLGKLQTKKLITRIGTAPKDPKAVYALREHPTST